MSKLKTRARRKNKKITLVLDIKEYEQLLDDLDELDSIRAFDEAKNSGGKAIPFEQAAKEIRQSRE
ncbi:MAG TPA: hypothetical protein VMJ93_14785 [Verrucomicrobiae bacterium]|nr:hypothetical protein [Verrucomicrobiae bacterium]